MTPTSNKLTVISIIVIVSSLASLVPLALMPSRDGRTVTAGGDDEAAPVRVAVFNGCGRSGLAAMFSEILREEGFDVVNGQGGNADSFDYEVSVVVARAADGRGKAREVADALGISRILTQHPVDRFIVEDVAVILGRDWNTLMNERKGDSD